MDSHSRSKQPQSSYLALAYSTKTAPHPQIMAPMDRNRDSKNPISKLTTKEMNDILSPPTPTIGSDQITNLQVVIHLHADIG